MASKQHFEDPFSKWLQIKPELEKNTRLMEILQNTIKEERFKESPYYLGSGMQNVICAIGSLNIRDENYHLAFRTCHRELNLGRYGHRQCIAQYQIARLDEVAEQIDKKEYTAGGSHVREDVQSQDFFGIISWKNDNGFDKYGLLVQDLTFGGKYFLSPRDAETAEVLEEVKGKNLRNCEKTRTIGNYFVDPLFSVEGEERRAKKYFKNVLDLGKL